jgi:DNA-binding winged helix-turn-helix (wHTH) protein
VIYCFADHALDLRRYELRTGGDIIALEPQVFALLQYLIEHRDRVVTRDELFDTLWAGKVVTDGTLSARIRTLRKALDVLGRSDDPQGGVRLARVCRYRSIERVWRGRH